MYHLQRALLAGVSLAIMAVRSMPVCAQNEFVTAGDLICVAPCATQDLFIRSEPYEQAEIISVISKGTEIEILSTSNEEWYEVSICGITGYVSQEYVEPLIVKTIEEGDIYMLAQAISAEAEGCGMEEKILVGKVILNRIESDYRSFSNYTSISEVLSTPNAYPVTWERIQDGLVPSEESLKVARKLLDGSMDELYYDGIYVDTDVLYQTSDEPTWGSVLFKTEYHYYAVPK